MEVYDFFEEESIRGNPKLKDTRIKNYDLRADLFPGFGQIMSLSGFYKTFKDPVILTEISTSENLFYANGDRAWLYGAEIEVDLQISHVYKTILGLEPRWLKGWSIYWNMALIDSRIYLDSIIDLGLSSGPRNVENTLPRKMPSQSAVIQNIKLTHEFDYQKWSFLNALLWNNTGDRTKKIGDGNVKPDGEESEPMSLEYLNKISRGPVELKFTVKNILNNDKTEYANNPYKSKSYSSIDNATRDELYKNVDDKVILKRDPQGISYSVSLGYKF